MKCLKCEQNVKQQISSVLAGEVFNMKCLKCEQNIKTLITARNLYQLNANEVPLTLHYGFEGRIIILHKNPY